MVIMQCVQKGPLLSVCCVLAEMPDGTSGHLEQSHGLQFHLAVFGGPGPSGPVHNPALLCLHIH